LSTSDASPAATDFERWIADAFAATGAFTALVVLLEIADNKVTPLCSTYFNVIGDEVEWGDITVLFAGSGTNWDGASFFPVTAPEGGPVDNPTARLKLRDLEARLDDDRLVLNEGHFFDKWGRRFKVEEIELQ
jgi:hypothetical protein